MKKILTFVLALAILITTLPGLSVLSQVLVSEANPFENYDQNRERNLEKAFTENKYINKTVLKDAFVKPYGAPSFSMSIFGDRFIVKFKDSVTLKEISEIIGFTYYALLADSSERLFLIYLSDSRAFYYDNKDKIEYLEADLERELTAETSLVIDNSLPALGEAPVLPDRVPYYPNDPLFSTQWEHTSLGMNQLWEITKGNPDVVVAVLDSGIYRGHEDLDYSRILTGYDAISRKSGVNDDPLGHGTSVIGIISSAHNNLGGAGIAPGVTILPIRVTNEQDKIYSSDFMAALRFAADGGADIINTSFGGTEMSAAEQDAVNYAAVRGCILVAAAGNGGNSAEHAGKYFYPASYNNVISVASLNPKGAISGFSQFNNLVDIAAPGEAVLVLSTDSVIKYLNDSGTSFAAPYVSGVAALLLSSMDKGVTLNSEAYFSLLRTYSAKEKRDDYFGYGVISPTKMMSSRNLPIIYGVYDGETYFGPATINFNRGNATLNGNKVSSGYKVELNGEHELVVTEGGNTAKAKFVVDTMPLKFNAPSGDTFNEPISITFSRGTATLNGYPYYSGKKIETSGHYKFVLTGPNGNTAEKVFTMYTNIPSLYGVIDGATYSTPVALRQIGEGTVLVNGVKLVPGKDTIFSADGAYTVTLSNFGLSNTRTVRFTIKNEIRETGNLAVTNPKILLDDITKLAIVYGESMKGIRIYNSSNLSAPVKFVALDSAVVEAIFTEKYLVLRHRNSITLIERGTLPGSGSVPVHATIGFSGLLTGIENAGGLLYTVMTESLTSSGLFYINTQEKTARRDATIPFGTSVSTFSGLTNRIYFWNAGGGDDLYYYNVQTASLIYHELSRAIPAGEIACADGYINIAGSVFLETDLNNVVSRGPAHTSNKLLVFSNKIVVTSTGVYNALTNIYYGSFKKKVSSIALSSDNTVFVMFDDKTVEVYLNDTNPLSAANVGAYLRLAKIPDAVVGLNTATSDYSNHVQVLDSFSLKDWVHTDATSYICAIAENDCNLYVFDENMKQLHTYALPMLPRSITTDGTKVYVTFDASRTVYILNTSNMSRVTSTLSQVVNARHTEAYEGVLYILSGSIIYAFNSVTATTKTLPLAENAVAFTLNKENSLLYVSFTGVNDTISVYLLSTLKKTHTYPLIVSSSVIYCDGKYIYSENLVYDCSDMALLYAMPGRLKTSNKTTVLIDKGVFDHNTKTITATTNLFENNVPLLTKRNEVFSFEKGAGFTLIQNPSNTPLGKEPEIKLEGNLTGKDIYTGAVTILFDFGYGYLNGYKINSGSKISDGGTHLITIVMPLGVTISKQITVIPVLSGIEISGGDLYLNINESRTLSVVFYPLGVSRVPVLYTSSDPSIVSVSAGGKLTGINEGTAKITASVMDGKFTSVVSVNVRSNEISFVNDIFYKNANGVIIIDRPGTTVSALLAAVIKGNGSAAVMSGDKEIADSHLMATGGRLSVRNINGKEVASAYISVRGDLDGDGILSAGDFLLLRELVLSATQPGVIVHAAADIDKNGKIDLTDVIMLESHLLADALLSNFDLKTNYIKEGNSIITSVTTAHQGSSLKIKLSSDSVGWVGANGAFKFDSSKLELISISAFEPEWQANYSVHGDTVYFNMYKDSIESELSEPSAMIITFNVMENALVGETLTITPLFLNSDLGSLNVEPFEFQVLQALSSDSRLKSLTVDGFENLISFNPDKTEYDLSVPFEVSEITITAAAEHERASLETIPVTLVAGETTPVKITVIAEDGSITEYIVNVSRGEDPIIVNNGENRLKNIIPSDGELSPIFDSEVSNYVLYLPAGIYSVSFELETVDGKAVAEYRLASSKHYIITCTAENGSVRVYNITLATVSNESANESTITENVGELMLYGSILSAIAALGITMMVVLSRYRKKRSS